MSCVSDSDADRLVKEILDHTVFIGWNTFNVLFLKKSFSDLKMVTLF